MTIQIEKLVEHYYYLFIGHKLISTIDCLLGGFSLSSVQSKVFIVNEQTNKLNRWKLAIGWLYLLQPYFKSKKFVYI